MAKVLERDTAKALEWVTHGDLVALWGMAMITLHGREAGEAEGVLVARIGKEIVHRMEASDGKV